MHQLGKQFFRPVAFQWKKNIIVKNIFLVVVQQILQEPHHFLLHPIATVTNKTIHFVYLLTVLVKNCSTTDPIATTMPLLWHLFHIEKTF
jgi:hypothetical protein